MVRLKALIVASLLIILVVLPLSSSLALDSQKVISTYGVIRERMVVGVNHWAGTPMSHFIDRDLPLLKEAGIGILRLEFGTWSEDSLAALVPLVRANGIEVLGILVSMDLIGNIDAWGDWVYNTVLKYKSMVKVWEIWNEPDYGTGFQDDPERYTEFLKRAYTRAKEADPTCYILAGAFTGAQETPLNYFRQMYDAGAKNYFDALSIHCYPEGPPEYPNVGSWGQAFWKIPLFKDLMDEKGDGYKKIWLTEVGWSTETDVSEEEQADYLVRALVMAKNFGWIETAIVFNWMDSESANLYYGLTRELYDPPYTHENFCKPSFFAVKDFISNNT
jgi:hypothetical protein